MKLRTQQSSLVVGLFVPFLLFVGALGAFVMDRDSGAAVAGAGVLLVLVGIAMATVLSRALSRDIANLVARARALGLEKPLPSLPASRIDELQELGRELESAWSLLQDRRRDNDTMDEELRRSEERYRGVVELSQELIWLQTDGKTVFANQALARTLGAASPDELIGQDALTFFHPEDHARVLERRAFMQETAGRVPAAEFRLIGLDGREIITEFQAMPFWYEGTTSVLAIGQDITERRQAENALRDSERRFRDFADIASDWMWELGPDLKFTYISENVAEKGGAPASFFLGKSSLDLMAASVEPAIARMLRETMTARRPIHDVRVAANRPGGVVQHVKISAKPVFDEQGQFMGYRGTSTDETAEAEAVKWLVDNDQRLRDFAEVSSDWLWEMGPDLRFTYISDRVAERTGIAPSVFIGKSPAELLDARMDPVGVPAHLATLQAQRPFRDTYLRVPGADGTPIDIKISGKPVFGASGNFIGYRGACSIESEPEAAEAAAQPEAPHIRQLTALARAWVSGRRW
jgi:PAS domain S-box-containing protein